MVIEYVDTAKEEARAEHASVVQAIQDQSLIYPVTFIDGDPVYDGAVSYPAIMRNVDVRLAEARTA